jgi:hypothetical protein
MTGIINLTAENYKRLVAIEIVPKGNVVTLSGRNAQGKTSILDAIWAALAGGDASKATQQPIRDGQDSAYVRLELDEYIITRRWTKDDVGTVTVESKIGGRFSSPQKLLDSLIGKRSFDPLEFTRQKPAEQLDTLLATVELPFDPKQLERERLGIYDARTSTGQLVKQLEGQLAGYPEPNENTPTELVSARDILDEVDAANTANDTLRRLREEHTNYDAEAVAALDRIDELKTLLAVQEDKHRFAVAELERLAAEIGDRSIIDTSSMNERITKVDEVNERVREQQRRAEVAEKLAAAKHQRAQYTIALEDIAKRKAAGLAEVQFPVDGLSFDESGVTFNGIPFSQASAAEKWRVSLALAMQTNQGIRIIQVRDGSLLDSESMKIVEELAAENDYQVWVEVVDESGKVGIVIEDGQVKA